MSSAPLSRSQKRLLEAATREYQDQLDEEGRAYLEARGLLPGIETLRFGLVRSPRPEHEWMRGRLAIPFIGPKGNVYDIRFRCIKDHDHKDKAVTCPKYMGTDGKETRLYNTRALMAPTEYLFLTEGELDAATLTICGWPAVGISGANAWKPHYSRMMAGFSRVVLIADGDVRNPEKPEQETSSEKLVRTFRRALPSVGSVMLCGPQDDVNSIYVREGKEGLMAFLKKGEEEE